MSPAPNKPEGLCSQEPAGTVAHTYFSVAHTYFSTRKKPMGVFLTQEEGVTLLEGQVILVSLSPIPAK